MKKLALFLAAAVLLSACGARKQKQEIERAAFGYLNAVGNYRFDEAVEYSSSATQRTSIKVFNKMMEMADTAKLMENTPAVITITGVRLLTDTTARAYYHKHTPIKEQTDSLLMVLEEGRWLADVRIAPPPFLDMPGNALPLPADSSIHTMQLMHPGE